MKIRSIGSNKTEVELAHLIILVSYSTPVACIRKGKALFNNAALKTNQYFSNTTSKHINTWLKDHNYEPSIVPSIDQEYFDNLLDDNT
jgi:hypothetical protein